MRTALRRQNRMGQSIMPKINQRYLVLLVSMLLLAGSVATTNAQGRINTPPEVRKSTTEKIISTPAGAAAYRPLRVPNVAGIRVADAENKLQKLGLRWKETFMAQPQPSLRRGHVWAVVPGVGTIVQPGDWVELRIPLAAKIRMMSTHR